MIQASCRTWRFSKGAPRRPTGPAGLHRSTEQEATSLTDDTCLDPDRWSALCRRLGVTSSSLRFGVLQSAYSEPHRHYHTATHIAECLCIFDECVISDRRDEVEYALWLHDAVWDPLRLDNEERSAEVAVTWLPTAEPKRADRIRSLVLATRHPALPANDDEALIQDIDLAILGAAPERFAEYEAQIRKEYDAVPLIIFRPRRRAILEGFLSRESIFNLPWFRARYEAQARENLERSIGGGR